MAIDKTIKINIDADEVIKKLEQIEKDLAGVKKGVDDNTKQMDGLGKSAKTTAQGMTTLAGGIGVVALALKALAISGIMRAFDFIIKNEFDFCEGNVIKYISRYKRKNGIEDLKKARQYIDFLIKKEVEKTK